MARNTVRVTFTGDARSLQKANRDAEGSLARLNGAGKRAFGALGKSAAVAGAAVAGGLVYGLKRGIDEFMEAERVMAQTNAVLKSTGGVANVTAKGIVNMAEALSEMSGVDDEVIQQGQNMLLTFTKVRNEVGKGNDIFDQATRATLDLSVALGKDMPSSALLVGKALNDPVKGVGALSRAGVQFTQVQKDQIKAMVVSGNTMGAQKMILGELKTQFEGSAKAAGDTFSGQLNKLKNSFDEVAGELVTKLMPYLSRLATWFANEGLPRIRAFAQEVSSRVGPAVAQFAEVVQRAMPTVQKIITGLVDFVRTYLIPIFHDVAAIARTSFERIVAVVQQHEPELRKLFANVGTAVKNLWAVAGPIVKLLFEEVLPRVIGIAIEVLAKVSEAFKVLSRVVRGVSSIILNIVDKILGGFQALAEGASKVPLVGDKFKGVAEDIGETRKRLRELNDEIKGTKGKEIKIRAQISFATGYAQREGGGGDGLIGAIGDGAVSYLRAHPPPAPMARNPGGLSPMILDELAIGQQMGLYMSSGKRAPSRTSTGGWSLHGSGQAIDMVGPPMAMLNYAHTVAGRSGVVEIISPDRTAWYPGVGWGRISGKLADDHSGRNAHVHVGVRGDGIMGDGIMGDGKKGKKKPTKAQVAQAKAARRERRRSAVQARATRRTTSAERRQTVMERKQNRAQRARKRSVEDLTTDAGVAKAKAEINADIRDKRALIRAKQAQKAGLLRSAREASRKGFHPLANQYRQQAADVQSEILDLYEDIKDLEAERDAIVKQEPEDTTGDEPADAAAAPDPDLQAQLAQANLSLGVKQRALDLQTAGINAGLFPWVGQDKGGNTIVFQSAWPPSPEILRQVGAGATEGIGQQGHRGSSVVAPGV